MTDPGRSRSSFPRAPRRPRRRHDRPADTERMARALELAASVRASTPPNPWVGCVIEAADGTVFEGATHPVGGPHAEASAIARGRRARSPRRHRVGHPRALLAPRPHPAVRRRPRRRRVSAGSSWPSRTPTPRWPARGIDRLRAAGIEVDVGVRADAAADLLAPYLHHRHTGRPYVVLKLAATLDGRTAAPDGTQPVDHRSEPPGPTPTACGPRATPSSSAPAPCGPTTRR